MGKGRRPCCDKAGVKKGPWSQAEDFKLISFVQKYGHNNWRALPKLAGLARCGKSCRLRWVNYLRPDLKRGDFTPQEEEVIIKLHEMLGNRWSKIASHFPGRTDNEIKNVWNTHLKKRLKDKYKCSSNDSPISCNASSSTTNTPNELATIDGCNAQQQHPNKQALALQKSDTSNDTIEYSSSSSTSSNSQASFSDHQMMTENNVEHHPNKDETSACEGKNIENSSLDELIEIPFEPNLDIWDLLHEDNNKDVQFKDVDTPILFENDNKNNENTNIKQGDHHGSWWWLVYLENELGLDHLYQSTPLQSTTNHTSSSSTHDLDFNFLLNSPN